MPNETQTTETKTADTTADASKTTSTEVTKTDTTTNQTDANKGDTTKTADKTIAEGGDAADKVSKAPQTFPDDWREKLAGTDAKELERLKRFGSPADMHKAYVSLATKVSAGELRSVTKLPENATAEQIAEYRKAHDVPEAPDKYDTKLDGGIVIGDMDKPIVDSFLKFAHENNIPQGEVKKNLQWFFQNQQEQITQQIEQNQEARASAIESLKEEWGGEYKANMNGIRGLWDLLPKDSVSALLGGVTATGTMTGDDPTMLKMFNQIARLVNPAGTVVPGSTDPAKDITTEIESLNKQMADKNSDYWRKPELQQRYRDLVTARDRLTPKAA